MSGRLVTSCLVLSCQRQHSHSLPLTFHSPLRQCVVRTLSSSSSLRSLSAAAAVETDNRWQLFASVIVERPPIVGKDRTELEEAFQLTLDDYEHEKSLKGDHEMRVEQDIRNLEAKRKGLEVVNEPLQTGFEYEEDREKLYTGFMPASRVSESDDLRSLGRLLDEKLYLVVPQFMGPEDIWFVPSCPVEGKASLREAVDEALAKTFGGSETVDNTIQVLGNAPFGFYKYRYPTQSQERQSFLGGKFFLFKAFLKDPRTFELGNAEGRKFAWMSKGEMKVHLNQRLNTKIEQCLFDY